MQIPDNATPEEEERILRTAMGRPIDKGSTFSTGGDVSRFQRKNPPSQESARPRPTPPAPGVSATVNGAPVYRGPSVRVTRGKATTEVPVGGAARGVGRPVANGVGQAGQTVPATLSTIR